MNRATTAKTSGVRRLRLAWSSAAPANDTVASPTAQDLALAELDAGWVTLHRRAIRGRSMRLTLRYQLELLTEELVLAHTTHPRLRVESWRVEMSQPIECTESFLLRVR